MLNLVSEITVEQQGNKRYPDRKQVYTFDFVHSFDMISTWENLTDTAQIVVPQKVYFAQPDGQYVSWQGKNIGGSQLSPPVIMRGDKVTVSLGYEYYDINKRARVTEMNVEFKGWVSKVQSKKPMTIHLADNMYKLQQIQAPTKVWKGYTVQGVIREMLQGTGFTLKDMISGGPVETTVNPPIVTQNQTVAQALEMITEHYKLECFFRGDTLYAAAFRYWPGEAKEHVFRFQQNIIEDDLNYVRVDDVVLGVQAYSFGKLEAGVRKDGKPKTSLKRYECFGLYERGELKILDAKPAGWEGELRTLNLPAESLSELKQLVEKNVWKLIYNGFEGSFTTFGLPSVDHGDNVILQDPILPDRNGTYKVKKVAKKFGVDGYRQTVTVDLRVDTLTEAQINAGI